MVRRAAVTACVAGDLEGFEIRLTSCLIVEHFSSADEPYSSTNSDGSRAELSFMRFSMAIRVRRPCRELRCFVCASSSEEEVMDDGRGNLGDREAADWNRKSGGIAGSASMTEAEHVGSIGGDGGLAAQFFMT